MNFLAHSYLSFDNEEIKVGNFIGDFIKGKPDISLPEGIKRGIILHRKIDEFTDKHNIFKQSVYRISKKHGKYRFVIVDLFYDHFLAVNWNDYHNIDLEHFSNNTYTTLEKYNNHLPDKFKYALGFMKSDNWLYNYQNIDKLRKYLGGISRRSKFGNNFDESVEDLQRDYQLFENDFREFFSEVIHFSKQEIKKLNVFYNE